MRWALVEDASVGGFAPSVSRIAADFVAFAVSEFVASFAFDSDARSIDQSESRVAAGDDTVVSLNLVAFWALG